MLPQVRKTEPVPVVTSHQDPSDMWHDQPKETDGTCDGCGNTCQKYRDQGDHDSCGIDVQSQLRAVLSSRDIRLHSPINRHARKSPATT